MSMKMASSIIIDLRPFDGRRYLPPGIDGGVEKLNSFRYGPSDLASPDRLWIFSLGRHEENYPCNTGCYVLDNGGSYSRIPSDVDQVVRLFCPVILLLVLLSMLIDYFNGCARAVYGLVSILGCLKKNTRSCHGRRKSLKTSKIC
jgi:hypothetical protein